MAEGVERVKAVVATAEAATEVGRVAEAMAVATVAAR